MYILYKNTFLNPLTEDIGSLKQPSCLKQAISQDLEDDNEISSDEEEVPPVHAEESVGETLNETEVAGSAGSKNQEQTQVIPETAEETCENQHNGNGEHRLETSLTNANNFYTQLSTPPSSVNRPSPRLALRPLTPGTYGSYMIHPQAGYVRSSLNYTPMIQENKMNQGNPMSQGTQMSQENYMRQGNPVTPQMIPTPTRNGNESFSHERTGHNSYNYNFASNQTVQQVHPFDVYGSGADMLTVDGNDDVLDLDVPLTQNSTGGSQG